jgi:SAM-dependent methyltransferase
MTTPATNVEQARFWNEEGADAWVDEQEHMDVQLAPFASAVYAAAGTRGGDRVLDVGCGCGVTTLELARTVGPSGSVVGVDISGPMIVRGRERAAAVGLENARFVVADAQTAPLPKPLFDRVVSRFGVMFFEDPTAAFANIRQSVRSLGRLTFVCWRTPAENVWASGMGRLLRDLLPPMPPPDPLAPGPFAFAGEDRVRTILTDSGWTDVEVEAQDHDMVLFGSTDLEATVDRSLRLGPAARALKGVDAEMLARVRLGVREFLEPQLTPNGVVMNGAVWIVTARNG